MLQKGRRDPFRHRLQEVGRLALEIRARGLLEEWVADGVLDFVGGGGLAGIEGDLEVGREILSELTLGRVITVVAEGGQARQDEATSRLARPFCRHALTNIRLRVMMAL